MKRRNGLAWQRPAVPEQTDGEFLLALFACMMIIGSVVYFWIWPLLRALIGEN